MLGRSGGRDWSGRQGLRPPHRRAYMRRIAAACASGQNCRGDEQVEEQHMADIRQVTERFAVAPQLALEDFADAGGAGLRAHHQQPPDGEAPDQPTFRRGGSGGEGGGAHLCPCAFRRAADAGGGEGGDGAPRARRWPICRSGTRSVTAWAMAQASDGGEARCNCRGGGRSRLQSRPDGRAVCGSWERSSAWPASRSFAS